MDAYNLMSEDQGSWFYMFIDLNNDVFFGKYLGYRTPYEVYFSTTLHLT